MCSISVRHFATTRAGGAGTAMKRLDRALNQLSDVSSGITTLYEGKYSTGYLRYILNHIPIADKLLFNQLDQKFTPTWLPQISYPDPGTDVVHLHWVAGFLSPNTIEKINSPIVWTLHDMWPLTGGCHYAKNCNRFSHHCEHCPALGSTTQNDISNKQFRAFQDALAEKEIYYIAPSEWIATKAEESAVVDGPVETIPNCLDIRQFKPIDQALARKELSIPVESNVVLTGGIDINDQRKGGDLLVKSLHHLKEQINTEKTIVMTFGSDSIENVPFETRSLGWVDSDKLPYIYSSADVMAVPSRYDNLPQIATEPIACGTPVVAFDTGGLSDIVIDGKTGFLVSEYDCYEFSSRLYYLLSNMGKAEKFGKFARQHAVTSWSFEHIARKHHQLYSSIH
jgi:glycosyltransferase involved in cell wall biosynthesis